MNDDYIDLVLLSDTHELHREIDVPNGDILIHAGDFTMFSRSRRRLEDFNDWLGELPHRHKLVVPGNHETFLAAIPHDRNRISNATLLIHEAIEVEGLRVWGSPVTPLHDAAFGIGSAKDRATHWSRMPEVDVLVTHGPPLGILDRAPGQQEGAGDEELLNAVRRQRPLLHVFGHVHGASGQMTVGDTHFVNAALLGLDGSLAGEPVVLRLRRHRPAARRKDAAVPPHQKGKGHR